ncbi:hypothetical protein B0I35DRAFT_348895 [Stachybotrys elegans]|uniref:DHHA2 domain-containing protein n=1 Tax=Stachybotrys elegans TaxID=80388 RepID=A0A8K0WVP3_9HYPO|nr:hypothetical protein B0I35DRAFT_348895 [Stachybotrys elegans]
MPPRPTLKSFLASARSCLAAPTAQRKGPITFVVGNEAADLDSLCSAVVLAYIRSNSAPHTLHVPLSNIPRADLALRTEMAAVLRHAGLAPADLLTLSDLPSSLGPEDARWLLVDHNALTGPLARFADEVVGCIDHHVDEGVIASDAQPRIIEPCGSCISLIVHENRETWDEISAMDVEDGDAVAEDNKLVKLALAPILIDTVNLTVASKVKDKDVSSLKYLQGKLQGEAFDLNAYFEEIAKVQQDISQLSLRDILRKDYKEWDESGIKLGISSVPQLLDYLVSRDGGAEALLDALKSWAEERSLDVVSIMTASYRDNDFYRELLVWGLSADGKAAVEEFVNVGQSLNLQPWQDGNLNHQGDRMAWHQGDRSSSRKQVAPLLRKAMANVKGRASPE